MNVILIDDDLNDLAHLKELCTKIPFLSIVETFHSATNAFSWLIENPIDLIISDVEMPDINGIEMIRQLDRKPLVIFVSSHPTYALESFSVEPLHYIVKPLKMESLLLAVHRAKNKFQNKNEIPEFIFVLQNKEYSKVVLNDLLYIEASENFVQLHVASKKMLVLANLTQFTKQLPPKDFLRIHKSWSININAVEKYTHEHIIIQGVIIPIGNAYKKKVLDRLKALSVQRKGES